MKLRNVSVDQETVESS